MPVIFTSIPVVFQLSNLALREDMLEFSKSLENIKNIDQIK